MGYDNGIIGQLFPEALREIREGLCPGCHKPVDPKQFKDPLSIKEYKISGFCQACQDQVFTESEQEDDGEE